MRYSERKETIKALGEAMVTLSYFRKPSIPIKPCKSAIKDALTLVSLNQFQRALLRLSSKQIYIISLVLPQLFDYSISNKLEIVVETYINVINNRYLGPRSSVPKRESPFEFIYSLDDSRFRQEARMSRRSFFGLVEMIKNHPIFSNSSYYEQAAVHDQLMVFLSKLGRFGNGGSVGVLARYFGISEGAVDLYI